MKFKKFTMFNLNLGCLEVPPVTPDRNLLQCSICEYTSPTMFYCGCFHVYCDDCVLMFEEDALNREVLSTSCVPCGRETTCQRVTIHEGFVSQLMVVCPYCNFVLLLKDLKAHLRCCAPRQQFWKSKPFFEQTKRNNNDPPGVSLTSSATTESIHENSVHSDSASVKSELNDTGDAAGGNAAGASAAGASAAGAGAAGASATGTGAAEAGAAGANAAEAGAAVAGAAEAGAARVDSSVLPRWQTFELVLLSTCTMTDNVRMFNATCTPIADIALSVWALSNSTDVHMRTTVAGPAAEQNYIRDITVRDASFKGNRNPAMRISHIEHGKQVTFGDVLLGNAVDGVKLEVGIGWDGPA